MLDDRALFVTLADAGSFSRAAQRLGVARSTVMRRLDALEDELGVTLMQRTGRKSVLTDAGRKYADALRPVLAELLRVDQRVLATTASPSGPLRVWLPILGTGAYLLPAVAAFRRRFPDVVVHLDMGRDAGQLELGAFDVALQTSLRQNPELSSRTFYREKMILVCAPRYVEIHGLPKTLDDVAGHLAIHELDVEGRLNRWRLADGSRAPMPPPSVVVNSVGAAFDLAMAGAGIARAPTLLANQPLSKGDLVQVLPEVVTEQPISLVFLPDPTPTTRAFLDFMAEKAAFLP